MGNASAPGLLCYVFGLKSVTKLISTIGDYLTFPAGKQLE